MPISREQSVLESSPNLSKTTFLFRGVRNGSDAADGNWWTEDAFYAASVSGNDGDLLMMVVPTDILHEWNEAGKLTNQTYRELNKNESEIEFRGELPNEVINLSDVQKNQFLKHLRLSRVGATLAVTRLFNGSGVTKSREIAQMLLSDTRQ